MRGAREIRAERPQQRSTMPERATAALTSKRRGDDDDDVVAEAAERLLGGHDADQRPTANSASIATRS